MSNNKFNDAVIEYFKKYYKQHKKTPPTRQIFKHFSKAKFYQTFPKGVAEVCKLAGIPVPEERLKRTQKARQATAAKVTEVQETARQPGSREDLQRSIEIEMEQKRYRKERAEEKAKEFYMLATDPLEAIRNPVLDAHGKILPKILKRCYKINLGLWGIKKLEEIMEEKDLTYEQLQQIIKWTELSDEKQQALLDLPKKLPGVTLAVIAEYAKLTDQEKQGVHDVCGVALAKHMKVMEFLASLNFKKRFKEDGVESIKL